MSGLKSPRAAMGNAGPFPAWSYDITTDVGYVKGNQTYVLRRQYLTNDVIVDLDCVGERNGVEIHNVSQFHPYGQLTFPASLKITEAEMGCWERIQQASHDHRRAVTTPTPSGEGPLLVQDPFGDLIQTIDPPATDDSISDELDASLDEPGEPEITVENWLIAEKNDGWYGVLAVVPGRTFYREMAQCLSLSDAERIVAALRQTSV